METFSTRGLKALFTYPFRKPGWEKKMLILTGFYLAGMIIPFFPWVFAAGYIAQIIRRATRESDPELPEWDDWNDLWVDGLRLTGVTLLYILPLGLIFGIGFGLYFGSMLGMTTLSDHRAADIWFPVVFFGSFGIFMCSFFCGTFLAVLAGVFMPAASTHVVVRESFRAAFHVTAWWRIFRANVGGYLVYFILLGGLLSIWWLIYTLFAYTILLIPFSFLLYILMMPFIGVIVALIWGQVYREAEETLALAVVKPDREQATSAEPSGI